MGINKRVWPLITQGLEPEEVASIMSNQSGIQTLLEAEQKAQAIVSEARSYRQQRVKAAKTDAAQEIADYKAKKEAEFQAGIQGQSESAVDAQAKADELAAPELAEIKNTAKAKQPEVVKLLVNAVTKPKPELHINAA